MGGSVVEFATKQLNGKKIGYINHDDAYGAWNLEAAQFQAKDNKVDLAIKSLVNSIADVTAPNAATLVRQRRRARDCDLCPTRAAGPEEGA